MAVLTIILCFVVFMVIVPIGLFFVVRSNKTSSKKRRFASREVIGYKRPSQPKLKPVKPTEYGVVVLSGELRNGLVKNCLTRANVMSNNYIYNRGDYVDYYDQEERKDMGEVFEFRVKSELEMYLRLNEGMTLLSQAPVGPGAICDFALVWKDIKNRKRSIVIECKYSNSRDDYWTNDQIEKGIDQLYRYRKHIESNKRWKVDLLVLFTSFPWHGGRPAQLIHNVLVINCDSMVGVFMDEVKKFHKKTIMPPVQESESLQEDNLNVAG